MAKKPVAKTSTPKKAASSSKASPKSRKSAVNIVEVCTSALVKLKELNLDLQLQSEMEWCLGSYANDGNPVGLYLMAGRALHEFRNVAATQPKAVPAKIIKDLENAVKQASDRSKQSDV